MGRCEDEWVYGAEKTECYVLGMLGLTCLSGFHGFRSLELGEERFILEMVVKAIGLHRTMLGKEKVKFCVRIGNRGVSKQRLRHY